jgi:molybdenum cofactor cytidylyltransferase
MTGGPIVGILLAAGRSARFGRDKLLVALADGTPMAIAALGNLAAAVDSVVAVVRPGDAEIATALAAQGARITECPRAAEGMGESLAWGVRAAPAVRGWVIALADMPWISSAMISRIVGALRAGGAIAAPSWQGRRGHPVGFAADYYGELIALSGDEGARPVVGRHEVTLIPAQDAGVLRDVDMPADLEP